MTQKGAMTTRSYDIIRDGDGPIQPGDRFTISGTFTEEDVQLFSALTGEKAATTLHLTPMVSSLFTVCSLEACPPFSEARSTFDRNHDLQFPRGLTGEKISCSLIFDTFAPAK